MTTDAANDSTHSRLVRVRLRWWSRPIKRMNAVEIKTPGPGRAVGPVAAVSETVSNDDSNSDSETGTSWRGSGEMSV